MEYSIKVKKYMTNNDVPFNQQKNEGKAMPLLEMTGTILDETYGMFKMKLHGVGKETINCMMCGRKLDNDISRHYGLGPICGQHFYELTEGDTIEDIKNKIKEIKWEGWVPKSAIKEMYNENNEIVSVYEIHKQFNPVLLTIRSSCKLHNEKSLYVTTEYIASLLSLIKNLGTFGECYDPTTKTWEVDIKHKDEIILFLQNNDIKYCLQQATRTTV